MQWVKESSIGAAVAQIQSLSRELPCPLKKNKKKTHGRVPIAAQQVKNLTSIYEDVGSIPGLAQPVKDTVLPQLWHRSQLCLGSGVALAVV